MRGYKNCDKVFSEGEGAPANPSKKRNKTKTSDRFSKKLTAKKRQSRALLFKNYKKFRFCKAVDFFCTRPSKKLKMLVWIWV
jgi:hypothetical protein